MNSGNGGGLPLLFTTKQLLKGLLLPFTSNIPRLRGGAQLTRAANQPRVQRLSSFEATTSLVKVKRIRLGSAVDG